MKAGQYAFVGRKTKKRINRGLNIARINAALDARGLSYSVFMGKLKKQGIKLDRKVLAQIARHYPGILEKIIEAIK